MGAKHKGDKDLKHNSNNSSLNTCCWCGKITVMEAMQLPETPILEFIEDKIDAFGRNKIWGENGDWSNVDMDSDFEAELLVYDQMLSTISKKVVCETCLHEDDKLWDKYYGDSGDYEIRFDAEF